MALLPGFARSGPGQSGLRFDQFLKEIQTKQTAPPVSGQSAPSHEDSSKRPPTPYEQFQSWRHERARYLLSRLDPQNQVLIDSEGLTTNPSDEDVERLRNEIWKHKLEAPKIVGDQLEEHHGLPSQFDWYFKSVPLDPERYTTDIRRSDHRLQPDGLHTGKNHWNKQWSDFIYKNPTPDENKIHEQLIRMLKDIPPWQ